MTDRPVPPRGEYLIRGGAVLPVDPDVGRPGQADVHVRDGAIVAVGLGLDAPGAEVLDAAGMLVMPGLIDSHWHMWSTIGRNYIADGFEYFPAKWATSAVYEPEDFYRSVRLGLVEAVNAGITTVHNWSHNVRSPAYANAELGAHRDCMVRARYSYGHRDLLPGDQALDFTGIDQVAVEWFGNASPFEGLVHLGVNLRGPDIGEMAVFDQEMAAATGRGLPVSIHTVQGRTTAVSAPALEAKGYLGPSFLLCHFLAATQADREAMARTSTPLSFAVHSELRLGEPDPRAALLHMLDAGVCVSLSIDAASLAPINLFEAMNVAWNMGVPRPDDDTKDLDRLTFRRCLELATVNGARALGLEEVTGTLTPGKRADVLLVRAHDLNVAPVTDLESTAVRSVTPANVDTVLVDGRILKRHGQLVAFDVEQVVRDAEESSHAVRARAGGRPQPGP
jgi:5-methylthioadenosine/S-adenosylhomocysteine deaminase